MKFSNRSAQMRTSHIREILKVAADPAVISFAGGLPAPDLFPQQELAQASQRIFAQPEASGALQYGRSEGLPALREWISARYRTQHGLAISPEEILITSGSQQGLDLLGKVLIDPGDPVLIEEPSYLGALQAFQIYGAEFHGVPLADDGVDVDALTARLAELRDVSRAQEIAPLFYTTPDFQNPSGVLCSKAKRERVARLAESGEAVVIEDSPYSELNFAAADSQTNTDARPPLMRSLSDRVILLGSFSKIIAPGLRLGWVCARGELYHRLLMARQAADLHTSSLTQTLLLDYLQNNDLDAQIQRLCREYGQRRAAMLSAIQSELPEGTLIVSQDSAAAGGMFLWARINPGRVSASAEELFEAALREGVLFVPGTAFYPQPGQGQDRLRLNFSNATPDEIFEGMRRLARAVQRVARPIAAAART